MNGWIRAHGTGCASCGLNVWWCLFVGGLGVYVLVVVVLLVVVVVVAVVFFSLITKCHLRKIDHSNLSSCMFKKQ